MKKAVLVALAATATLSAIGFAVVNNGSEQTQSNINTPMSKSSSPAAKNQPGNGNYLDYRPDIIANTSGTKLLFFYAPWCPQCRALEADIQSRGVPPGVSIIKVDYDSNQALRQKYGVTIQTTLVKVDDQGKLVQKYVAYDEPNLESVKENLL